jgi:stearoyl-CoA desaturase (delta-9 desaturase)
MMVLGCTRHFPVVKGIRWFNLSVLLVTPTVAIYGVLFVPHEPKTLIFSLVYYTYSMLGQLPSGLQLSLLTE